MVVNPDRVNIVCDVDGTLVKRRYGDNLGAFMIVNPYDNTPYWYDIHTDHVELIRQYHGRGFHITVWSANGSAHAAAVVDALGLRDYVHETDTKPMKFLDDKTNPSAIIGSHVFIPRDGWYVS